MRIAEPAAHQTGGTQPKAALRGQIRANAHIRAIRALAGDALGQTLLVLFGAAGGDGISPRRQILSKPSDRRSCADRLLCRAVHANRIRRHGRHNAATSIGGAASPPLLLRAVPCRC